jgi:hypothetical protein
MPASAGGDDPPSIGDDLASVIEMLEGLIGKLWDRVRINKKDRIGPATRSILIDALLPEIERVLAKCPDNSQVRVGKTYVSSRQNRADLGDPNTELVTLDELTALETVRDALCIEHHRRGGKNPERLQGNPGSGGFGHDWRTRGFPEPDSPRYIRRPKNQNADVEDVVLQEKMG